MNTLSIETIRDIESIVPGDRAASFAAFTHVIVVVALSIQDGDESEAKAKKNAQLRSLAQQALAEFDPTADPTLTRRALRAASRFLERVLFHPMDTELVDRDEFWRQIEPLVLWGTGAEPSFSKR